jgi:transcriptional regulator with XRE-family HTH domain
MSKIYNIERIKTLRENNNFTQNEISDLLGITAQAYGRKENGKRNFSIYEAQVLADFYSVQMEELFFNPVSNQNVHKIKAS